MWAACGPQAACSQSLVKTFFQFPLKLGEMGLECRKSQNAWHTMDILSKYLLNREMKSIYIYIYMQYYVLCIYAYILGNLCMHVYGCEYT